jgi:hypothetical protein
MEDNYHIKAIASSKLYECPICMTLNPQLMCPIVCMHTICIDCYGKCNKKKCSICNSAVVAIQGGKDGWIRNLYAERQLMEFKKPCEYCKDPRIEVAKLENHKLVCTERPAKCTECNWEGPNSKLQNHIDNECIFVKKECEWCKNTFYKGALDEHVTICNYKTKECGKCGIKLPAWQFNLTHSCKET